jgi:primosomal protein N'
LINSTDKDDGRNSAKEIYLAIRDLQKTYGKFPALSLMEAPLKKLSGQYRFQAVMRLNNLNAEQIINETYRIVGENKPKKGTAFVELNPQNLY